MIFSKSNPLRLKFHWFLSKTECGYVVNLLQPFRFDFISNTWFILTGGTTIMTLICDQLGIITDNVSMEKERRGEATTVQSNWHCEWLVDGYPLGAWTFKLWLCECVCVICYNGNWNKMMCCCLAAHFFLLNSTQAKPMYPFFNPISISIRIFPFSYQPLHSTPFHFDPYRRFNTLFRLNSYHSYRFALF